MATLPLSAALAWGLALLMHWWPRLDAPWRRRLSVATSAAGLGFLVAAVQAEGLRESALTSVVLVGSATLTATTSASASLYYYVLTAVCLLLGFAGLALGEPLSRWLAPRVLLNSTLVAWLVTLVRFLLEKSAAPAFLVDAMGVTWLAPVAGAYFASDRGRRLDPRGLARLLARYAFLVRGAVAAVGVASTRLGLGTHYDVSPVTSVPVAFTGVSVSLAPASASQLFWLTLVPQLVLWPVYTVVAGLAGAALARLVLRDGRGRG
ncbi:MAG TPA: hypothetical protein VGB87_14085 [Vicinamibacteria bacterium]